MQVQPAQLVRTLSSIGGNSSAAAGEAEHQRGYVPGSDILQRAPASDRFIDDLTGQALPRELCMQARARELEYFDDHGVWIIRQIS